MYFSDLEDFGTVFFTLNVTVYKSLYNAFRNAF